MTSPWLGMVAVLLVLAGALACFSRLSAATHPEIARKGMHVTSGLVTLSFPYLFKERWPVVILATLCALGLFAFRRSALLRVRFCPALDGVSRASFGDFHFILGAGCVFVLAAGDSLLFSISMLVLTFADAAAALVGTCAGRHRYAIGDAHKSVEGSAAFCLTAWVCVFAPLSVYTALPAMTCAMAATATAVAATGLEAVATRGLDNVLVPVGAFAVLNAFGDGGATALALCLAVAGCAIGSAWWPRDPQTAAPREELPRVVETRRP